MNHFQSRISFSIRMLFAGKFPVFLLMFVFLVNFYSLCAQADSLKTTEIIKTGWNFGLLPAVGFDSDLGLQYGGMVNFFDYGDGSSYPNYDQSIFLMAAAYTKGSKDFIFWWDSYSLVPGMHLTSRASFNNNQAIPFYGFNGYESVYNPSFEAQGDEAYISRMFYRHDRKHLKINVDLQDTIKNTNFGWFVGWDLSYISVASVDIDKLNEGQEEPDQLPDVESLYDRYVNWGLISAEEANGGLVNSLKLGLTYDSRDRLSNPTKGIWTEVLFRWAPRFLGNGEHAHNKLAIIHRQYFSIVKDRLSFAYRFWYNGTLGKKQAPFYIQPILTASNYYEGFGGAYTMRGVLMNRIVGDDYLLSNVELRYQFLKFRAFNQNFELGTNIFFDSGRILDAINWDLSSIDVDDQQRFFNEGTDDFHFSYGAGFKFVMNKNFVVSADYGRALNAADGSSGFYIAMNYLF